MKPNLNDPDVRERVNALAAALQRWVWDAELGSPEQCAIAGDDAAKALENLVRQHRSDPSGPRPEVALRLALRAAEEWV